MPTEGWDEVVLRPAVAEDLPALAELYLRVREASVPAMPAPAHTPEEVRGWVRGWDLAALEVYLAERDGEPVGLLVLDDAWLESLYVAPEAAGHGIGSALLDLARGLRPDGFCLWVFESNEAARRFYARHGLVELERTDGSGNEERAPDIRLAWPGPDPLAFFRRLIDEVDVALAGLLARRVALTAAVQEHKLARGDRAGDPGRDAARESEVVARMAPHVPDLGAERLARVMHTVIAESLAAWEDRPTRTRAVSTSDRPHPLT